MVLLLTWEGIYAYKGAKIWQNAVKFIKPISFLKKYKAESKSNLSVSY